MEKRRLTVLSRAAVSLAVLAVTALPGAASAVALHTPPPPPSTSGPLLAPLEDDAAGALAAERVLVVERPPYAAYEDAQIVAFYGFPGAPVMGVLGDGPPAYAASEVARVASQYDALNGERAVVPALHLIVGVAQAAPGAGGDYLARLDDAVIEQYVDVAREDGLVLILDVQVGWADPLEEVRRLERYLALPFVQLALDPEFATRGRGVAPGTVIGSLGAADVNLVQRYLAGLVRDLGLPPKLLVLHQFLDEMLTGTEAYEDHPEVLVTVDMDGFGGAWPKLSKYDLYSLGPYSERAAIKLFYNWDAPVMTPAELAGLERPPDLVIYQ